MATGPADGLPSLSEREVAELDTVPQVAAVVALVLWAWRVAAAALSTGPKLNTPAVLVQVPVVRPGSMDQLRPVVRGWLAQALTLRARSVAVLPQLRTPVVMAQPVAVVPGPSMAQVSPAGRVSEIENPWAVPVPLLVTVTV